MSRGVLFFALSLTLSWSAGAQRPADRGLVVTGSVQSIDATCVDNKPVMRVLLYVQFRNDGDKPLALIPPSYFFKTKINFVTQKPGDMEASIISAQALRFNPYQDNPYGKASEHDYDPFPSFVTRLDSPEPPKTLPPGGYLEFPHEILINKGFHIDDTANDRKKICGNLSGRPVPDYPSFILEYHLSLKKEAGGEDLLIRLRERWKPVGHLVLDSDGDVSYKSEKIYFETSK